LKDLQKGNMVIVVATEGQTPESATPYGVACRADASGIRHGSEAMLSSAGIWVWRGEGGGDAPQ